MALAQAGPRSLAASAWPIYLDDFTLTHGQTVEYRTIYTTPGVDPVMHLLRRNGSSWVQVASNDNYSGLEARISWTNSTGLKQRYLIVLRSKGAGLGVCDVFRNGSLRTEDAPVMGQIVPATALGFAVSDELLTNHRPGGSITHAVFTLTTTSGLTIGQAGISNGIGGAAYIGSLTGSEQSFLVGTPWVMSDTTTGTTYDKPHYGLLNLFGNDIGTDISFGGDLDLVGNALEDHLLTCKTAPCPFGYFARDSDRDGLTDGEELWGIAGIKPDGSDDVPLARWGADPRRKDVFVEIDFGYDAPNSPPGVNPFAEMNPAVLETWVDTVRAPFLAAPASHVKNPNGADGIQLHLDLGVAPPPLKRYDEWRYGNYSSASQRCVVKDWQIDMKSSVTGQMRVVLAGTPSVEGPWVDVTGLSPFAALQALVGAGHPSADIAYRTVTDGTINRHIDSGEGLPPGQLEPA